jgi:hypothetical protein
VRFKLFATDEHLPELIGENTFGGDQPDKSLDVSRVPDTGLICDELSDLFLSVHQIGLMAVSPSKRSLAQKGPFDSRSKFGMVA